MSNENYKRRSNLWTCIVYPDDSLPKDYMSIIINWHIPVLLSPIHDSDKNADDKEKKKHIHILLDFGSGQNKSFDQVRQFTDQLKGTIPEICHNKPALIRYFIHKDNPEKHQYKQEDLVSVSGFEFQFAFENFSSEVEMYKFIEDIVYDNMIYNYAHLIKYMSEKGYQYELMFVRHHTMHFQALLNGYWQLITNNQQYKIYKKGEVLKEYPDIHQGTGEILD